MQKVKTLYIYILLFVCLYIEFGYAIVVANQISGVLRSLILVSAALPLLLFKPLHSNKSVLLLVYLVIVILSTSIRDNSLGDYLLFILPILLGYLIATRISINFCIKCFCDLIYYLALYSLVLYLICSIVPAVATSLPYIGQFYDTSCTIHNAIFSVVISGATFPRNFGFTWEPGAFALLLCIATFCSLHCYNSVSKKRLLVYSIAIITTFSTMGYIVLILIYLSTLDIGARHKKNIGILLIGVVLIIIAMQIPFMQELVFGKLEGLTNSNSDMSETTEARINAIIFPGLAFIEHPILGVGYDEFKYINIHLCDSVATNTIVNWFSIFGILLGAPLSFYYLYSVCKLLPSKTPIAQIILICLGSIILVSTESLLRISLIYVIIFWGTLSRNSKELING